MDSSFEESPEGVDELDGDGKDEQKLEVDDLVILRERYNPELRSQQLTDDDYEPEESGEGGRMTTPPSRLKREAEDEAAYRPLKSQRGLANYLDLLNTDIENAALGACFEAGKDELESSQIGLTYWSSAEKGRFFESLRLLGRDNLAKIASRIRTKSVVEIKHYIDFLNEEREKRKWSTNLRKGVASLHEHPAAVELSQQCCYALDQAASSISLREEQRDKDREQKKWGELWDLTPSVAVRLKQVEESTYEVETLPSIKLFHLSAWLRLSRDVFMNSSIPANNWKHVENVPPSIWATTLEDFRSLTISMTRRLVQSTLYTASTRIRSTLRRRSNVKQCVRRGDVQAALSSLGMAPNAMEFWRKCARRNRMEVFDYGGGAEDEEAIEEPTAMTYDEVERALRIDDETCPASEFTFAAEQDEEHTIKSEDDEPEKSYYEEPTVDDEANEVFDYSLADFPETHRMKSALRNRIVIEQRQEQFAEDFDQHASYKEELEMWALLMQEPPVPIPKVADTGPLPQSNLDVESMYPLGRDWRKNTRYYGLWERESTGANLE